MEHFRNKDEYRLFVEDLSQDGFVDEFRGKYLFDRWELTGLKPPEGSKQASSYETNLREVVSPGGW